MAMINRRRQVRDRKKQLVDLAQSKPKRIPKIPAWSRLRSMTRAQLEKLGAAHGINDAEMSAANLRSQLNSLAKAKKTA